MADEEAQTPPEDNTNPPPAEGNVPPPAGDGTPPADAAAAASAAAAEGKPAEGEQQKSPPAIDNFRHRMANGDEKKLARLERYGSEQAVADALFAAQQKISSGEYQKPLPDTPTEEEVKEYRETQGIPQEAKDYKITLPEGFAFGEEDQPNVNKFLEKMHAKHATSEQVSAGLSAYAEMLEEAAVQQQERDSTDRDEFENTLRTEYGDEYKSNMNIVHNFISSAPEEVRDTIAHSRGPDGKALLNDVQYVRWLNDMARELNPAASVVRQTGTDNLKTIDAELEELTEIMNSDLDAWHRNPTQRKKHRLLLEAKSKLEKRSA